MSIKTWTRIVLLGILFLWESSLDAGAAAYTSNFPLTENPISEGGNWINGQVVGLDWSNCATSGGMIHGVQNNGGGPNYNDSIALLTGAWGSNQTVTVTLYKGPVDESLWPEAEIHLRCSLSAHSATGYEVLYSMKTDSSTYIGIVRWNGAYGDFTGLGSAVSGTQYVATNGSTLKATIVGSTITAYLNGVPVVTTTDKAAFPTGNPGVGFDHNGGSANDGTFGFTTFTATDGLASPVISTQPQSQSVNLNSNAIFQVSASGTEPLSYQWYYNGTNAIAGATGSQLSLSNVLAALAGNYSVVVSNPGGSVTSAVALLTVVIPQLTIPVINKQPSSQSTAVGTDATFDVSADGTQPLLYQWYFNGNPVLLANASTLNLNQVQAAQAGDYSVVVANLFGSVTSAVAQLTVLIPPSITNQPSDLIATAGNNVSFQVSAAGSPPLNYQWWFGGSTIEGATTSSLTLTNVQAAQAGGYSVVVNNSGGSVTSRVAQLTVMVGPSITSQPTDQTAIEGTNVSFQVSASGSPPLSYQWWFGKSSLPGATTSSLILTNVQMAQAGGYSVVVANEVGSTISTLAQLTVLALPTITSQPVGQTVVVGTNASFEIGVAGSPPLSYQWFFGGSTVAGATSSNLVLTNVQPGQAGSYGVVVTNVVGAVTSTVAQLTVLVPPSITSQPTNQSVVEGANTSFSVNATGTPPLSYQWLLSGVNLAGAASNTLSLTNVRSNQAGAYSAVVTNTAGSITSVVASLTILVPPAITKISLARATVSLTLDSVAGLNYMLEYKDALSSPSWISLPPGTPGTGRVLTLQDTNAARTSGFYRIQSY